MVRKTVANHQAVAHSASTIEKIHLVREGEELAGKHKVFGAAYRPLSPDKPSPTVTRSGFRDFVHPHEDRCCTVRELARLQTFPDSYAFEGRRCDTYAKSRYVKQTQHEQLGNAVPPLLARKLAAAIRAQLFEGRNPPLDEQRQHQFATIYPILDGAYTEDLLGNMANPVDELVYILLSRRAREAQYQATYRELAKRFRPWIKLLKAEDAELIDMLRPLGLANQRVRALRSVIQTIVDDFGSVTLRPLRGMGYSAAYNYLRSLPGVNDKTAKCVMLYSLGLPALPVDTHTLRVSKRLGLVPSTTSLFLAPRTLEIVVPRPRRGRYHILTVLHGRALCTPRDPKCHECALLQHCPTGLQRMRRQPS